MSNVREEEKERERYRKGKRDSVLIIKEWVLELLQLVVPTTVHVKYCCSNFWTRGT